MTVNQAATFRVATDADMPAIFDVRTSVRENHLSRERLDALGITPDTVAASFEGESRGWVTEAAGRVVAFAIADRSTRSIFALFVHPDFDGRGYGAQLLRLAGNWLMDEAPEPVWLTTGAGTRAERFYRRRGWHQTRVEADGQIRFEWQGSGIVDGPMIDETRLDLVPLKDAAHIEPYHRIRRVELFERYDPPGAVYDPGVAGEDRPTNLAHVLLLDGLVIGTIRIDLIDRAHAGFRLVAVAGDQKYRGYGAWMLARAEAIVRAYGRCAIVVNASKPARTFYERQGYSEGAWFDLLGLDAALNVRLGKRLE